MTLRELKKEIEHTRNYADKYGHKMSKFRLRIMKVIFEPLYDILRKKKLPTEHIRLLDKIRRLLKVKKR